MTQEYKNDSELLEAEQVKLSEPSFKNGYNFFFKDGSDVIRAYGSEKSGKEIIYINGKVKSESRNLRSLLSRHVVMHDDHEYEISFITVGIMRGEIECSVLKDGFLIGRETKALYESSIWGKVFLGFFFGVGIAVGYLTVADFN